MRDCSPHDDGWGPKLRHAEFRPPRSSGTTWCAPRVIDQSSLGAFGAGAPAGELTRARFLRAGAFCSPAAADAASDVLLAVAVLWAVAVSFAVVVSPVVVEPVEFDAEPASPATFVNGADDDAGALRSTGCRVTGAPALEPARRRGRFVGAGVVPADEVTTVDDVASAGASDVDAAPCVGPSVDAVSVLELASAAEVDGVAEVDVPDSDASDGAVDADAAGTVMTLASPARAGAPVDVAARREPRRRAVGACAVDAVAVAALPASAGAEPLTAVPFVAMSAAAPSFAAGALATSPASVEASAAAWATRSERGLTRPERRVPDFWGALVSGAASAEPAPSCRDTVMTASSSDAVETGFDVADLSPAEIAAACAAAAICAKPLSRSAFDSPASS